MASLMALRRLAGNNLFSGRPISVSRSFNTNAVIAPVSSHFGISRRVLVKDVFSPFAPTRRLLVEESRRSFSTGMVNRRVSRRTTEGMRADWFRTLRKKAEWLRLLKKKKGFRLLLKSSLLNKLHSSIQTQELKRTKNLAYKKVCLGSTFAERSKMMRAFYESVILRSSGQQTRGSVGYSQSLTSLIYCAASSYKYSIKRRRIGNFKRIELPTHYAEVSHRTQRSVIFYGPNIYHSPHNVSLKGPNVPRRGPMRPGQNV